MATHLDEEARRGVADDDATYHRLILPSEMDRAHALVAVGRPRDALNILSRVRPWMVQCEDLALCASYYRALSEALLCLGRIEDAQPVADEAVELARTTHGPRSEEAHNAMCCQAQVIAEIGRVEEAKETLRHVLATRTRLLGPEHVATCKTQEALRRIANWTV